MNSLNMYDFGARWFDYADKYDFDMKSQKNPLNWGRNSETIIGEDVKGEESSLLLFKYVTPNKLFQDTKKIKDTKTIVDPNGKEKNSFVEYQTTFYETFIIHHNCSLWNSYYFFL